MEFTFHVDIFRCIAEDHFFWNSSYLDKFLKCAEANKDDVPGHSYFRKIDTFVVIHYEQGELYCEFTRGRCDTMTGTKSQELYLAKSVTHLKSAYTLALILKI